MRTMGERVGHRAGTAGPVPAWTSEFLRRMAHGTGQSCLYRVVLVSEMQKVFYCCGSRRSMAISHATQARKNMLAVTASQPTNTSTTLKHLLPGKFPQRRASRSGHRRRQQQPTRVVWSEKCGELWGTSWHKNAGNRRVFWLGRSHCTARAWSSFLPLLQEVSSIYKTRNQLYLKVRGLR